MNRKEIACIAFSILAIESSLGMDPYGNRSSDLPATTVNPYANRASDLPTMTVNPYEQQGDSFGTRMDLSEIKVENPFLECGRNSIAEEKVMEAPEQKMMEVPVFRREFAGWTRMFRKKIGYGSHWEQNGTELVPEDSGVQAIYYGHDGEETLSMDGKPPYD